MNLLRALWHNDEVAAVLAVAIAACLIVMLALLVVLAVNVG